jgi:hypothetical protein
LQESAGDVVTNEWGLEPPEPDRDAVPLDLEAWAQIVDVSKLSDEAAKDTDYYLRKYRRVDPNARNELAFRLVSVIARQVSPPPPINVAPLDIFSVVLAARRRLLGIG